MRKQSRRARPSSEEPTNELDRLILEFDLHDEPDDSPPEPEKDSLEAVMREFGADEEEPAPRRKRERPQRPARAAEREPLKRRVKVTAHRSEAKPAAKRERPVYIPLDDL